MGGFGIQSTIKMFINHEHVGWGWRWGSGRVGREGVGEFVIVWYWGSIIKRHYTFAKFLCSIGGLGVH